VIAHRAMHRVLGTISTSPSGAICFGTYEAQDGILLFKTFSRSVISEDDGAGQRLLRECCVLEELSQQTHPNIISYVGFYRDANLFCLTTEYVGGGDLFTRITAYGPMDEASARRPAAEICAALGHMHSLDFVHLDVKTENIVITAHGQYKLADFGSCVRLRRPEDGDAPPVPFSLNDLVGTPETMAPEVIRRQPVGQTADWWSYGCVLFEMLTRDSPFYDARDTDVLPVLARVLLGEFTFPTDREFSNAAIDLVRSLVTSDPSLRLGASPQGHAAVAGHAWFEGFSLPVSVAQPSIPQLAGEAFTLADGEMPTGAVLMASLVARAAPTTVVHADALPTPADEIVASSA